MKFRMMINIYGIENKGNLCRPVRACMLSYLVTRGGVPLQGSCPGL